MKATKRVICLLLSFILLWNSTSYLAEAQEADNEGIKTESSEIETETETETETEKNEESTEEVLQQEVDKEEAAKEAETMDSSLEAADLDDEQQKAPKVVGPEDVFGEDELITNIETSLDKVTKSITLQWEKVMEYDGIEAVIYQDINRKDEKPIVIDLLEKGIVEDVNEEAVAVAAEGEEAAEAAEATKLQKVVLNKDAIEKELADGVAYYIDVRAYVLEEVAEEAAEEAAEESIETVTEGEEEPEEKLTYKKYGKILSTVALFLTAPVVTVKAGDAQCTVSWSAVKGAAKYEVVDASTGKVVKTVKGKSVTITKLKNSVKYKYQVRAIAELKAKADAKELYTFVSELSGTKSATTKIVKPGKASGLTLTPYNLGAILKWKKVSGATQYEIYRYDTKTKKWKSIKKTTSTTYKNTGLTNKRKYTYKVRAIRSSGGKTAYGEFSSTQSITAKKYLTESVHPMYYYARVRSKTSLYKASTGTAKAGYLKAGTKVTVLKRAKGNVGRCYVKVNGKGYWLARKKLTFYGCKYTTKDYTKEVKEEFVNSNGYSSKTKYLIWISSYTQKVNIFKGSKGKWKLYKTYKCTTGRPSAATVQGTYRVNKKISRYGRYTYEKYLTCFYGLTSFHSRLYRNGRIVDSRLGKPISGGCMRMYTDEAKFIYKNMPKNTTVLSY